MTASPITTRQRGAAIETAARAYLLNAGLTDVAANACYRVGELDLVMLDHAALGGMTLVFVEVRYRRGGGIGGGLGGGFGGGAASIDAGKRRRLVNAAQAFLGAHREHANAPCRFDVIDASGDPSAPALHWLKDAFRADD